MKDEGVLGSTEEIDCQYTFTLEVNDKRAKPCHEVSTADSVELNGCSRNHEERRDSPASSKTTLSMGIPWDATIGGVWTKPDPFVANSAFHSIRLGGCQQMQQRDPYACHLEF